MADVPQRPREQRDYLSYLLRMWRVSSAGSRVWRASLKNAHTGEQLGFTSLEELFDFLRTETNLASRTGPGQT